MSAPLFRDIRSPRFWRLLGSSIFTAIGAAAVLVGVSAALWPDETADARVRWLVATLVLSLLYGLWRSWPRSVERNFLRPAFSIRIVTGDLFEQPIGLVIGMTTTFDTAVPSIISPNSVQGQLLDRVFESNTADLDLALHAALSSVESTGEISKPGKGHVYPVGTTATVERGGRKFYCVAYSEMNNRNEARATIDGLWLSLSRLWEEVRVASNGQPVAIAVVGGGQARVGQLLPPEDSVRFIAMSFVLASRHTKVCDRLDIVVMEDLVNRVDMPELQAFLDSLRGS